MKHDCIICKQRIIDKKEKWVRLTDFDKGIQGKSVYYHLECWRDRFVISNSIRKQKMYSQTMKAVKSIKDNLGKGGIPQEC